MCKIKQYSETMQGYLTSVLCRFDTYLLEDDKLKALKSMRDSYGGNLSETFMDDLLQQDLDIDNIALLHDITITEVLRSNILVLKNAVCNKCMFNVYVHKYFVAIFAIKADRDLLGIIKSIIEGTTKCIGETSVDYVSLRLFYSAPKIQNDQIWDVFDRTAFPVMEGSVYNGRYTDTSEKENINIDLTRTISPSQEEGRSDVYVQTTAFMATNSIQEAASNAAMIISMSKNEITRCFSK